MNLGKTFKTERERLGVSRPEMAKRLGLTASALWKIEAGRTQPKQVTIEKFCLCVGVSLGYVIIMSLGKEDFNFPPRENVASDTTDIE